MNEGWAPAVDGGALRLFCPSSVVGEGEGAPGCASVVDVAPHAGTMVLFRSDKIVHEVRPAHKPRYACSMWFHAGPTGEFTEAAHVDVPVDVSVEQGEAAGGGAAAAG